MPPCEPSWKSQPAPTGALYRPDLARPVGGVKYLDRGRMDAGRITGNYMRVKALAPQTRWNKLDDVLLVSLDGEGLKGSISGLY